MAYAAMGARAVPPIVATFHRSGGSALYTLLRPLARTLAGRFAVRVAVSEAAAATARRALGGSYEVLFNGIEVDRYAGVAPWPTVGPTALFLGRHEERKGLGVLLAAWRMLSDSDSAAAGPSGPPVLWVAGDGPETADLRRRYPDAATLQWLGVVDEEEKIRRLVATDVLAAPALGGESFGLVVLEGMAARAVVVASDIDGYRDAAGGCAVLVPPGDARALSGALRGVLDGSLAPDVRGACSGDGGGSIDRSTWLDAGGERAERWSMERLAGRYEDIYRHVVVGRLP